MKFIPMQDLLVKVEVEGVEVFVSLKWIPERGLGRQEGKFLCFERHGGSQLAFVWEPELKYHDDIRAIFCQKLIEGAFEWDGWEITGGGDFRVGDEKTAYIEGGSMKFGKVPARNQKKLVKALQCVGIEKIEPMGLCDSSWG